MSREEVFAVMNAALKDNPPTKEEIEWVLARVEYNHHKRLLAAHKAEENPLVYNYPSRPPIVIKYWDKLIAEDPDVPKVKKT
jgi:hypothetical protein